MHLNEALAQLDHDEEGHWTSDGQPRLDVLSELMGRSVKRNEVIAADSQFTRTNVAAKAGVHLPPAGVDASSPAAETETEDTSSAQEGAIEPFSDATGIQDDSNAAATSAPSIDPLHDQEIFAMSFQDIVRNPVLAERAWRSIDAQLAAAHKERDEVDKKINKLNNRAAVMDRIMTNVKRNEPNAVMSDIQKVLERGAIARAERVANAQRFIAAGTTAGDVANQLRTKSKLDESMARKVGYGAKRPAVRLPAQPAGA